MRKNCKLLLILLLAFVTGIMLSNRVFAKTYPVEAFEGTWEGTAGFTDDYYFNMTFGFIGDSEIYMDYYEEFMGGSGSNRWTGPYTFDPSTGILDATISTTWQIGSGDPYEQESALRMQLTDLNELIRYDADGTPRYFKRISEPPVLSEEEEDIEAEETEAEETEAEEAEAEETETVETEEEETEADEEEAEAEDEEEESGEEEESDQIDLENADEDTILKWLLDTDDEHLNQMKTAAAAAGTTLGAIVVGLLSAGAIGGGFTGPGGTNAPGYGGDGITPSGKMWEDYENEIKQQVAEINQSMTEYENELERQWEEAGVAVYDKQRYQDMMAERENQAWIEEQRMINNGLSREAIEWSQQKKAMEQAFREEDKRNQLFYKKGIYDGDYKEYKKKWIQERQYEAEVNAWYESKAAYMDAATKTAENVKAGADLAIDVMAELEPTGTGKQIKNGYKFLSEAAGQTGEVMAGNQSVSQAIKKTITNSTIEYIKDNVDSTEAKFFSNVSGDGLKGYINARIEGKSHEEALKQGTSDAKQGLINFAVDYGVGKAGDAATGGVKIGDKQVFNGIYKKGASGENATRFAHQLVEKGFTKEAITNDHVKNSVNTLVSDLIKNKLSED